MTGTIDIPKVGPVKKPVVLAIGGGLLGLVGFAYWRARSGGSGADAAATDPTDPGYEDPGVLPSVAGAVNSDNLYGSGTAATTTTSDYGFTGTTNSQWTQYATTQLQQSESWSYTDIASALGNYITNKPLSTLQQQIVQAAIGVAGYPPEGSHTIIPGGDTAITVAPTGVSVTSTTATTATVTFSRVAGAASYRLFRSGISTNIGAASGPPIVASGLTPNTEYGFQVQALTSGNSAGPKSATAKGKTKAVTLATPHVPTVSAISKSSAHVSTGKVANATAYLWYVNGVAHGHSDAPAYTLQGLKANTAYGVSVAADTATGAPSKQSARKSFRTKR